MALEVSKPGPRAERPAVTVWYDGACPLCRREIAVMRWLDRRGSLQFIDVSNDGAQCPVDRRAALLRLHAMENERILSGAAAFAAMWRAIPALRWLGLLARFGMVERLLERAYVGFLSVRPRLQRLLK
ncbi:MAG: DUF393 domain-containing protein [Novosphingobium sp.]